MKILINNNICQVEDVKLQVGQNTEYKPAGTNKVSVGTILRFKYAGFEQCDKKSGWMYIEDLDGDGKEWISLQLWYEHRQQGLFSNKIDQTPEPKKDDTGNKPQDISEDALW